MVQRLVPVARIGEGRAESGTERGELVRFDNGDRGSDGDQHDGQSGQEPPRPPGPEAAQVQPAAAGSLGDQQVGDQVSAEYEEDIDAEPAARRRPHALVEDQDREDCEGTYTVQAGYAPRRPQVAARSGRLLCRQPPSPPARCNAAIIAAPAGEETR